MKYVRRYGKDLKENRVPKLKWRAYFFNEGLTIIPPEKEKIVVQQLSVPTNWRGREASISLQDMTDYIKGMESNALASQAYKLQAIFDDPDLVKVLGGAGREAYSVGSHPLNAPFLALRNELFVVENKRIVLDKLGKPLVSPEGVAKAQVALARLSKITLEDWYQSMLSKDLPAGSPVRSLVIESGIFEGVVKKHWGGEEDLLIDAFR